MHSKRPESKKCTATKLHRALLQNYYKQKTTLINYTYLLANQSDSCMLKVPGI
jgi:hypothetical protein